MTIANNQQTEESPSSAASASKDTGDNLKKRSKKKKKHISKHVIKAKTVAKERTATESADSAAVATGTNNNKSKKKMRARTNDIVKDPEEASNYLKAWQAKQGWKFNKNTQSWLLRHMYETEKVSKSTFAILLEYTKGLQGKDAKTRLLDEATARAQRYREYEKEKEEKVEDAKEEKTETQSTDKNVDEVGSTSPTTDNDTYGLERWKTLDDHDKRKEYKRARRVLQVLTVG